MICVHYDAFTGEVLGAYDSAVPNIPTPHLTVTENEWNMLDGLDKKVDLVTLKLVGSKHKLTDAEIEKLRRDAYTKEADPLFFKYQRKECSKADWLNKIQEIKDRYPKSAE